MGTTNTDSDGSEQREHLKKLFRGAAIHLVWIVVVLAVWAGVAYVAFEFAPSEDMAFAVSGILLLPAGIAVMSGGQRLSDRFS